MIYLDASALVTLVAGRTHVSALRDFFLAHRDTPSGTSTLGFIETVRNCDRTGSFPGLMRRLVDSYVEIPVTESLRDAAAMHPGGLKTLDAIHVASAESLGSELTVLVTYDKKMADAARAAGLPVAMPGLAD